MLRSLPHGHPVEHDAAGRDGAERGSKAKVGGDGGCVLEHVGFG